MEVEALVRRAAECIMRGHTMQLVVPVGKAPKGFPRGELMCQNVIDGVTVRVINYDPIAILRHVQKFIAAQKTGGAS